jgi:hypothetical protein
MEGLNNAFFNVLEKLLDLQPHFISWAWNIARVVMLIALGFICIKHAINGQGLKEGLVKLGISFTLFAIIINAYPRIIQKGNELVYNMAASSTYDGGLASYFTVQKMKIIQIAEETEGYKKGYYGYPSHIMKSEKIPDGEPRNYFTELFVHRTHESSDGKNKFAYTTLAPKAALEIILLIAGEAMQLPEKADGIAEKLSAFFTGMLTALAVMITGIFGICEYLICMLEFMLVTSVGVILLPFMLWDSSKFLTEKLIGAIIGFFVKLLFCNICIFLMLYGFMMLATNFTETTFTGTASDILQTLFTCVLFFLICKAGPNLAQSLLTGSPSLNSGTAFAAVGGAVAGAAGAMGLAGKAGSVLAGGAAKTAFHAAGAATQAGAAAAAVGELGGTRSDRAGAALSSLASSAGQTALSGGSNLAHSLLGGGAAGVNRHSQLDKFKHGADGGGGAGASGSGGGSGEGKIRKSFGEHLADRSTQGENMGVDYMVKKEASLAAKAGQNKTA